jgi:GNAT superfamily N-acetyltransferase
MFAFEIGPGVMADYERLAHHHYIRSTPRVVDEVYVARIGTGGDGEGVARGRSVPAGAQVGVLVTTFPMPRCADRERVLGHRYAHRVPRHALHLLNADMRTIARVVVHGAYRGLGVGTGLVRHAIAQSRTPCIEALATMGRVHTFFESAGMHGCASSVSPRAARLEAVFSALGLDDTTSVQDEPRRRWVNGLAPTEKGWLRAELQRWHGHRKGRSTARCSIDTALVEALADLWREPTYYIALATSHGGSTRGTTAHRCVS